MHLCSLSITYACPYHNPTAIMVHLIHNIDISKPLTHKTPYTLSSICPVQWKPGFIHEENTSPKCQTPLNVSICPLKSVTMMNCRQVETPMRTTSAQMSFPETVSDSLCRNYLVMQIWVLSRWLVSDDFGGKDVGCGGPGLVWLHVVCGCEAGWMYCHIIWKAFGDGLWEINEHSIHMQQLWWTFLQSACQLHAPSKLATSVALCCVIKLHILEWPFIVASLRHTCAIIMLSNQYLDMPHLWSEWIISAKEKSSHLYLYSTFNNTNFNKATAQYQNRKIVNNVKWQDLTLNFQLKAFH